MTDIRFCPASQSDFERLLALRIAAMRPSLERIGRFDLARSTARFRREFVPAFARLVHLGGLFAGCVSVRPLGPGLPQVEHFYVVPEAQGRGLGGAVLRTVTAEADATATTLRIEVLRESDANRFYQRHGFVETHRGEWDIYYERRPVLESGRSRPFV